MWIVEIGLYIIRITTLNLKNAVTHYAKFIYKLSI